MPCLCLDDLAERPERDPVAVGEAASLTPRDQLWVGVDDAREFVHEAALADPRHADDRHELWDPLVPRSLERVVEDAEFALAADQLGAPRVMSHVHAEPRTRAVPPTYGDGLGFALRLDRRRARRYSIAWRVARCVVSSTRIPLTGAADSEPRRSVDDVPRGHALARVGPRVERDEGLAGRDPDAAPGVAVLGSRSRGSRARHERHVRGRPRALSGAPKSAITASPMNFSTVPPYAPARRGRGRGTAASIASHVLGVHRLGVGGQADQVAEEHGHDLALPARRARAHAQRVRR